MKRLLLGVGLLGAAAFLFGCPIYPGNEQRVCQGDGCYSCPDTTYSGACITWQCSTDSDCDSGYVCNDQNQCVQASTTTDAGSGDCSTNGCPDGYVCKLSNSVAQCVPTSSGGSDAGVDSSPPPVEAGTDATDAALDVGNLTGPCNADSDCGGTGERCVDGTCTPRANLCSDGTQCNATGSSCVDGICEVTCSATTPCPSGYGCDFTRGVCNLNAGPCTGSGTSSCQGGATCVEGHCVPPCASTGEGGTACVAGQVCVNGGCIPDQGATFTCANDGDEGQLANTCPDQYTCLHHDCYPSCEVDSGDCVSATAPTGATCKNVTIETGTYAVCAPTGMLGSDCDPSQGKACSTGVCINGTCN
ncbi:MAG TPA: hypothetical protein VGG39_03425 [Polyangiaceae bacterium]